MRHSRAVIFGMHAFGSGARRIAIIAIAPILATGCARYGQGMEPVLERLSRADPRGALADLERHPREHDALYQLERGMLLRLVGRYAESSRALEEADRIREELYTRSVSREAASLAVSDRLRPYVPPAHERLLLHHYETLNYLDEGDMEGALVEARRTEQVLDDVAATPAERSLAGGDLVLATAALVHEAGGETDEALRLYRRILADRGPTPEEGSGQAPGPLGWILRRVQRLSPGEGGAPSESPGPLAPGDPPPAAFTVVVFIERGFVPPLAELRLRVPILKSEAGEEAQGLAPDVGDRIERVRDGSCSFEAKEISYWLEIALPAYGPEPLPPDLPRFAAADGGSGEAIMLDVARSARAQLDRDMPGIMVREALRALIKYEAHREAERRSGEVGGFLMNALGVASEQAETRTWLTLPHDISLEVLELDGPVSPVTIAWSDNAGGHAVEIHVTATKYAGFAFASYRTW